MTESRITLAKFTLRPEYSFPINISIYSESKNISRLYVGQYPAIIISNNKDKITINIENGEVSICREEIIND